MQKKLVRTGTRTQNLLLRRQAPYPLGHTDDMLTMKTLLHTSQSSLGVEHSLSKRKVVGSNPAFGYPFFSLCTPLNRTLFFAGTHFILSAMPKPAP